MIINFKVCLNRFLMPRVNMRSISRSSLSNNITSLYVHWPYCRRRCIYCNFNKYVSKSVDHSRMRSCLVKEATTLINLSGIRAISSVFFGGGTPSLAEAATVAAVLTAASQAADLPGNAEVSMEVNPTAVQANRLREFKQAGINRVSIGVQTLCQDGLQVLGRDHSVEESLSCLEMAHTLFPGKVSLDLMFGWPGQTMDMWIKELEQITAVCDKHLSLYQLTVERGTPLFKLVQAGELAVAGESLSEDMYLHAVDFLQQKGFERYEVSNFAKQYQYCLHNMSYWDGGQYIGVGPGAHGRFQLAGNSQREARVQTLAPEAWMDEVERQGHGTRSASPLSVQERLEELLVVGLRTKWGVPYQTWSALSPDKSLTDLSESPEVQHYFHTGLLKLTPSGLQASVMGLNVIDSITVGLLSALSDASVT